MNAPMHDCFRDAWQRAAACRALLATGELGRLWTEKGPTHEARALAYDPSTLSRGQRALLLTAWAFWSGTPVPLRFDELVGLKEAEPICKLTTAALYGPKAIDVWLTRSDDVERFAVTRAETHASAAALFDEARAVFAECSEEPMNFSAAPDACAMGAFHVAQYVLMDGVSPVRKDRERYASAMELTRHVLGLFAAISRGRAAGDDAEDGEEVLATE